MRPTFLLTRAILWATKGGDGLSSWLVSVFLLDFLVGLLLILAVNRISGFPPSIGRSILGALVGAVFSVMCLVPGFHFLGNGFWRVVSFLLMGSMTFGWDGAAPGKCALLFLLHMALGGIVMDTGGEGLWPIGGCAALLWLLCRLGFPYPPGSRRYVPVRIVTEGGTYSVTALCDTGNTLTDPLTGESVLVAGPQLARQFFGSKANVLSDPVKAVTSGNFPGLRLIPFHSVGCGGGLLPVLRFHDVMIGGSRRDVLIAFASEEIGRGDGYQMLTGGV